MTGISSSLTDYLGEGPAASRPVSLNIPAGALGLYYSTDTLAFTLWNGSAWVAVGGAYTLPAATSSTLGGVKPDGTTLTNSSGAISVTYGTAASTAAQGNDSRITGALSASATTLPASFLASSLTSAAGGSFGTGAYASAYSLPAGTSSILGGVKPDGTTITNTAGAISVTYGTVASTAAAGNDSRIIGALAATTAASTYAPLCNRIINGAMSVDQRNVGASQTITAGAALAYTVDRFFAYCTGANVTGQQAAGSAPDQYVYKFTGAASVTAIGFSQRIEAKNSFDLAGTTATLSAALANSVLTTVTWTAYYATTADTFGTLASPTKTQIATGTFTVNSTLSKYSAQIAIPSAATTGLEIRFSVGAQTSGTWTIGEVQLNAAPAVTPFERLLYGDILYKCMRYYQSTLFAASFYATAANQTDYFFVNLSAPMRVNPTLISQTASTLINATVPGPTGTFSTYLYDYVNSSAAGYAYAQYTANLSAEL